MKTEEIAKRYFGNLDPGDGRTLNQILTEGAGKLIGDLPDNAEFPSERSLAETLKVHRNTIRRALEPYIRSGALKRNKRRTLVSRESALPAPGMQIHPLQLQAFLKSVPPVRKTELQVYHYENMPEQKRFWQETAQAFERKNPGISIQFRTPSDHCLDFGTYMSALKSEKPDMIQLPPSESVIFRDYAPLLEEIPKTFLSAGDYRMEFFERTPEIPSRFCPVGFSYWTDFFNRSLLEQYRISPPDFSKPSEIAAFASAANRLPEPLALSLHIYSLLTPLGMPKTITYETIRNNAKEYFHIAEHLYPRGRNAFFYSMKHPYTWFEQEPQTAYLQEQFIHMVGGHPLLMRNLKKQASFPIHASLMSTGDSSAYTPIGMVSFGVNRNSPDKQAALEFCRHLLSEPEQKRLARLTGCAPFHRSSVSELEPDYPGQDLDAALRTYALTPPEMSEVFWSGKFSHDPYLQKIIDGTGTIEQMLERCMKNIVSVFPQFSKEK